MILKRKIATTIILSFILLINGRFSRAQTSITGAWHSKEGDDEAVMICKDGYIVITEFNQVNTQFAYCSGGACTERKSGQLIVTIDFTTRRKEIGYIGTQKALNYSISGDKISVTLDDSTTRVMTRLDDGLRTLAGVWRLTSPMTNKQPEPKQADSRQTIKILSGKRFQWVTFDPEKNEFIGGGGGTYAYTEGKYTESIECYAKDSYKIGTSITFDATLDKDAWTIKGKGIEERWSRIESLVGSH